MDGLCGARFECLFLGWRVVGNDGSLGMTGNCVSDEKSARPAFFLPSFVGGAVCFLMCPSLPVESGN